MLTLIRPASLTAHLPAMPQQMVGQHAGHHRLADRYGADADAGSWRPLVTISVSLPCRSIVRRGVRIDEVGLTAKRTTTCWPEVIPPRMPPAWLDRNRGPSLPMRISSAFSSPECGGA